MASRTRRQSGSKGPFQDPTLPLSSGLLFFVAINGIPIVRHPSWKGCAANWAPPSVFNVRPGGAASRVAGPTDRSPHAGLSYRQSRRRIARPCIRSGTGTPKV